MPWLLTNMRNDETHFLISVNFESSINKENMVRSLTTSNIVHILRSDSKEHMMRRRHNKCTNAQSVCDWVTMIAVDELNKIVHKFSAALESLRKNLDYILLSYPLYLLPFNTSLCPLQSWNFNYFLHSLSI